MGGEGGLVRLAVATEERTAKFLESVGSEPSGELRVHMAQVNGEPGVVITAGGEPISALILDVSEGVAQTIHLVANPEKLAGVRAVEASQVGVGASLTAALLALCLPVFESNR